MGKGNKRPKDDKANMKLKKVVEDKPTTLNGFESLKVLTK